jgi:cell division FtsZ-interacting protein ZapD
LAHFISIFRQRIILHETVSCCSLKLPALFISLQNSLFQMQCFLVRASSYIPIRRPKDAACERFLFSIHMYITRHVSSVKRSSASLFQFSVRAGRPDFVSR